MTDRGRYLLPGGEPPTKAERAAGRTIDTIAGPFTDGDTARDARLIAECRRRWPDYRFAVMPKGNQRRVEARWTNGAARALATIVPLDGRRRAEGLLAWQALFNDEVRKAAR